VILPAPFRPRTDFRSWHLADIVTAIIDVGFHPESGHPSTQLECPLSARRRHYAGRCWGGLRSLLMASGEFLCLLSFRPR
jgi:hypothetical protein